MQQDFLYMHSLYLGFVGLYRVPLHIPLKTDRNMDHLVQLRIENRY